MHHTSHHSNSPHIPCRCHHSKCTHLYLRVLHLTFTSSNLLSHTSFLWMLSIKRCSAINSWSPKMLNTISRLFLKNVAACSRSPHQTIILPSSFQQMALSHSNIWVHTSHQHLVIATHCLSVLQWLLQRSQNLVSCALGPSRHKLATTSNTQNVIW